MDSEVDETKLLEQIRGGYQASTTMRDLYEKSSSVQAYVRQLSGHLSVRYRITLVRNALDAAISYTQKARTPVNASLFKRRFEKYFQEQLLVYGFRKQTADDQFLFKEYLGDLLLSEGKLVERNLIYRFSKLDDQEIRNQVAEAIKKTLERLGDKSFKLTSSLRTFLYETAEHLTHQHQAKQKRTKRLENAEFAQDDEDDLKAYSYGGSDHLDERFQTILQEVTTTASQYVSTQQPSPCQAFLAVYWRLNSPFDFIDPVSRRMIRDELIQERLALTDAELALLKSSRLKLTQPQVLQLVSGVERPKQKVNDFYQRCLNSLLSHLSERLSSLPFLSTLHQQTSAKQTSAFKRQLAKWMQTIRKNPMTTS